MCAISRRPRGLSTGRLGVALAALLAFGTLGKAGVVAPTPGSAVTATLSGSSAASGEPMPVGDLPGWHQVFTEDFLSDAQVGTWPGPAYGPKWDSYRHCWHDTSGLAFYYPDEVVSVSDGVLTEHLHSEPMHGRCGVADTRALVAAIVPKLPSPMVSGKYTVRFRADSLRGYKTAWLLWPDSNNGNEGEIDFPEGELDGTIAAFMHYKNNTSSSQQDVFRTTATYDRWHTTSIEWVVTDPINDVGSVTFILDGQTIGTSTRRIPVTPMHWVLQTETCPGGWWLAAGDWRLDVGGCQPSPLAAGNVRIDWVVGYARDTTTTVTPTPAPPRAGIALKSTATANNGAGANHLTIAAPTGVTSGDVLLAQVAVNDAASVITPPEGWVQIQRTQSRSSIAMASFYRVAGTAEPGSYTFTFDSSQAATGGLADYSGVNTAAPVDASSGVYNENTATARFAQVTTTQANDLLVAMVGVTANTTVTQPAGFTERYDVNDAGSANGKTVEMSDMLAAVAGLTSVGTASEATNVGSNLAQLVALRSAQ
jgi:Glycosyl hydrolases family 16